MEDWDEENYQDYLDSFKAWGHEYHAQPLDFDRWYELREERYDIDILEECEILTAKDKKRREQIDKLLLDHESYFEDGPRIIVQLPNEE